VDVGEGGAEKMTKNNGEPYSLTVAQNIALRSEIEVLQEKLGDVLAKLKQVYDEATISTHCIATMLHVSGLQEIELSDVAKRKCYEETWLRVKREIIKYADENIGPSVRLTLVPVTKKERKENDALLAKEKRRIVLPGDD
jgi:hypothetical protein